MANNPELQSINDDIQAKITSKQTPITEPLKVQAQDEGGIMTDIVEFVDKLVNNLQPLPQGVEWVTPPGDPVFGSGTVTEQEAVISVDGVNNTVPEATLTQPAVGTGMHRIDITVVHYSTLGAPVYEILFGNEVATSETVVAPAIPAGRFMVRQMLVKEGAISVIPPAVVSSVSVNGEAPAFPGLGGNVSLTVDANIIPYTPADLTWWAAILSGSVAIVKEALDYLQTAVKALQADKADKKLTINTQTANYILALSDAAGLVRMNVATANTLTVPPNASVAFPVGTQIVLSQAGAGQTTLVPGSGVTINSFGSKLKFSGQYAGATLVKVDTNTWTAYGNLTV